jgi:peptidyl-prolyl cis-trans isomerase SurA
LLDAASWTVGERVADDNSRKVLIVTHAIEAPRLKNLDESRGPAISDYQNTLEKEWIEGLRKQFTSTVNEGVLNTILKK